MGVVEHRSVRSIYGEKRARRDSAAVSVFQRQKQEVVFVFSDDVTPRRLPEVHFLALHWKGEKEDNERTRAKDESSEDHVGPEGLAHDALISVHKKREEKQSGERKV